MSEQSTRDLTFEEAASLKAGADHYRAYVGPPDRYDLLSGVQFSLLFANGMRSHHKVLDFGCGSLRLGRLLIPFLRPGNYYGIDPNRWLIEEALKRETGEQIVEVKSPSFAYNDDFDCSGFNQQFDFIMAQSIITHTGPDLAETLLQNLAKVLKPDGLLLFTYGKHAESPSPLPQNGWFYPGCVFYSDDRITDFVNKAGLEGRPTPWFQPACWYAASKSASRLPSANPGQYMSGGNFAGSQPVNKNAGNVEPTKSSRISRVMKPFQKFITGWEDNPS